MKTTKLFAFVYLAEKKVKESWWGGGEVLGYPRAQLNDVEVEV
jgi:hypothetical protein